MNFLGVSHVIPRRAREEGDGTRDGVEKHGVGRRGKGHKPRNARAL